MESSKTRARSVPGACASPDKNIVRERNILRLEEVLDEAVRRARRAHQVGESIQSDDTAALADMMGVGAVVYGILSQNRQSDLVFDWDRMLSFEGNSALSAVHPCAGLFGSAQSGCKRCSSPGSGCH